MTPSHTTNGSAGAKSFDRFVEHNFPTVYRFAFCMSLAHESAARLTQTAFAQALRARKHGAHATIDKRWLLTTLHHEWAGRTPRAEDGSSAEFPALANPLIDPKHVAELDQAVVLGVLHGMKAKLRLALSLFYFEQLSYSEIAAILDIPPQMVIANLAEAKAVMRRQLEEHRTGAKPLARPRVSETKAG